MLINDFYARIMRVSFQKEKPEALEKFKIFKAMVENQTDRKLKCVRLDMGGEFTSNEFYNFCEEHGLRREFTIAKTPQTNGVAKR